MEQALGLNIRIEKRGTPRLQLLNYLHRPDRGLLSPSVDDNSTSDRIEREYKTAASDSSGDLLRKGVIQLIPREERRSDDDSLRSRCQRGLRRLHRADASAQLTWQFPGKFLCERDVVTGTDGSVEINELHQRILREAVHPLIEVVKLQGLLPALHELDNLAAHQIDGRNQHGHLTGIPCDPICSMGRTCAWVVKQMAPGRLAGHRLAQGVRRPGPVGDRAVHLLRRVHAAGRPGPDAHH